MYDCIIVGAGIAGAVTARKLAEHDKKILILEQRDHIGGNCYDYMDHNGILIHKYGPHIFHTNSDEVYEFLSGFTKWSDYHHEVLAYVDGKYIPVPFNLNTLDMIYDSEKASALRKKLTDKYGYVSRVAILELMQEDDKEIREIAEYVYQNIFLKYTMKQWGQKPEQMDSSVTARVPVLISEDNGYFQDKYQGMPLDGYTKMFETMLSHEGIDIRLSTNAAELLKFGEEGIFFEDRPYFGEVVYTGPIDELFDRIYGRLPYRTLRFEYEEWNRESYQPAAVVNYTVSEDFTRITEFKKLTGRKSERTTIVKEYSGDYTGKRNEIPYYAILNEKNIDLYKKYLNLTEKYEKLHMLGRLAEYKYYNIDAITLEALKLAERLI